MPTNNTDDLLNIADSYWLKGKTLVEKGAKFLFKQVAQTYENVKGAFDLSPKEIFKKAKMLSSEDWSQQIVEFLGNGLKSQGRKYVWGGVPFSKGTDCSGLMCEMVKKTFNVDLPRNSKQQYYSNIGQTMPKAKMADLKPGDLLYFNTNYDKPDKEGYNDPKHVSHVGVYLGNGEMLHAPSTGDVMRVIKIPQSWSKGPKWIGAKRIVDSPDPANSIQAEFNVKTVKGLQKVSYSNPRIAPSWMVLDALIEDRMSLFDFNEEFVPEEGLTPAVGHRFSNFSDNASFYEGQDARESFNQDFSEMSIEGSLKKSLDQRISDYVSRRSTPSRPARPPRFGMA